MFSIRTTTPCVSRALSSTRPFSTSIRREADFTHAVVGGGVVGLAIARKLQDRDGASTVLIEKHGSVGTETSSRNSEVIHAGLYYGTDSLKARLCLKGKRMLYELCQQHSIPHRNTGKWLVAQDSTQMDALQKVHDFASSVGVPTKFLSPEEAKKREPDVRALAGVLESPTTGIVDSHSLMQYLEGDFENKGGICAFNSPVTHISPIDSGRGGWSITTTSSSPSGAEETTITAETLINSAGLYAVPISNMILPPSRQRKPFYAKGSYFSYSASQPRTNTLIYPAPVPGHAGLGTHLTLDMAGRIRFGPDVQWTDSPTDYTPNTANLAPAIDDIQRYLPGVQRDAVQPDYVGIRPKLGRLAATSGKDFQDFYIVKEEGLVGFVNLLAIESPGLTSCLAIAEEVEGLLYA
ncbi:L-2-hydroxyglutarate dehydrogenase mitochondrial precursor [Cucurbitaria berberidis CBS 394.84]|uniref:L-2-hydroxyglutarate dehydrogenase, mitochondrial n=1 Tax=Cucurbitaria berberidis CBS 394.84 TaxID=1168544 RepID=A0A9P4GPV9_9PLEO|nr:L-2-hydroxyglutarate dehydrogenase mitochondrial precursor [Cucurbitaria berberidis CBS 394.84]KAF1850438.1 L-2-hydroxyglutarate dehydrogenase mitochondrial precursor [Cucurbitaria berberidis CBS 394.84]